MLRDRRIGGLFSYVVRKPFRNIFFRKRLKYLVVSEKRRIFAPYNIK